MISHKNPLTLGVLEDMAEVDGLPLAVVLAELAEGHRLGPPAPALMVLTAPALLVEALLVDLLEEGLVAGRACGQGVGSCVESERNLNMLLT